MPLLESVQSDDAADEPLARSVDYLFPPAPLAEAVIALLREVAARELMPRFRHVHAEKKPDGSLVTEANRAGEAAWRRICPSCSNIVRSGNCP